MTSARDKLDACLTPSLPFVRSVASGTIPSVPIIRIPKHNVHVPFPCAVDNSASLINAAKEAPFGRKDKTLFDEKVRSGLQIAGSELSFNQAWLDGPLQDAVKVCESFFL